MNDNAELGTDPEFVAMQQVHTALAPLDIDARQRVLDYVCERLGIQSRIPRPPDVAARESLPLNPETSSPEAAEYTGHDLDGISPIAQKWLSRNNLTPNVISSVFSLGIDDIDLVAKKIPGDSKRARAVNVALLKGIAQYLATGVARITHQEIKEACVHYDAYDGPNHAKTLKAMGAELSGLKENGYQSTAKGITAATAVLSEMLRKPTST